MMTRIGALALAALLSASVIACEKSGEREQNAEGRANRQAEETQNEAARKAIRAFLADLCSTIVLDPACGSANFLYVTMEHMKRLEGEAREELRQLGETQELLERAGLTVESTKKGG